MSDIAAMRTEAEAAVGVFAAKCASQFGYIILEHMDIVSLIAEGKKELAAATKNLGELTGESWNRFQQYWRFLNAPLL